MAAERRASNGTASTSNSSNRIKSSNAYMLLYRQKSHTATTESSSTEIPPRCVSSNIYCKSVVLMNADLAQRLQRFRCCASMVQDNTWAAVNPSHPPIRDPLVKALPLLQFKG